MTLISDVVKRSSLNFDPLAVIPKHSLIHLRVKRDFAPSNLGDWMGTGIQLNGSAPGIISEYTGGPKSGKIEIPLPSDGQNS